jgi:hypothetical protein
MRFQPARVMTSGNEREPRCSKRRAPTKSSYEFGAEWLPGFDPGELPIPPEDLVRVLHAMIEGLVMQRILTPELCPDEVFYAAFAAFARH